MPTAIVRTPDGKTARITGSPDQIRLQVARLTQRQTFAQDLPNVVPSGITQGVSDVAGAVEHGADWLYKQTLGRVPGMAPELPGAGMDVSGQLRRRMEENYPVESGPGRLARAPIRGATAAAALPIGPFTGAVAGAAAIGETAREGAEQLGAPPLVQAGVDIGSSVASGMGIREVGRRAAVKKTAENVAKESFTLPERIAANRVSGAVGGPSRLPQAEQLLAQEVAAREAGQLPVSVGATLEQAAPGIQSMQRALARQPGVGERLSAEMAQQRQGLEDVVSRGAAMERAGVPETLRGSYTEVYDRIGEEVSSAYRDFRRMHGTPPPPVNIRPLRAALAGIRREVRGLSADDMPSGPAVDRILESNAVDVLDIERIRRIATNKAYEAGQAGNPALQRNWLILRDGVERTLDRFATLGRSKATKVQQLRDAIGKRREMGRLFDERLGTSKMFEYDSLVDGFQKRVLGSKNPAEEVNRLRLIIAQSENPAEATQALQTVIYDSVFGPAAFADVTEGALKSARNKLLVPKNIAVIDAAFGAGSAERMRANFQRGRRALSERIGTVGETRATGSNIPGGVAVFGAVTDPTAFLASIGMKGAKKLAQKLGEVPASAIDDAMIRFYTDPHYALRLTRLAREQDLPGVLSELRRGAVEGGRRPLVQNIGEGVE